MSNDNLNMPRENKTSLLLANRGQLLDDDGNYSLSRSPDSDGCNFNLSERKDCSSNNNLVGKEGSILQPHNYQRHLSTILESSHITTLDNDCVCVWDEYLSELNSQDTGERNDSAAPSPDYVGMSSCGTSCRGSTDLSFSSEELLIRNNTFVLEEQSVPSGQSSLAESPAPPVFSPADPNKLLPTLSEDENSGDHICHRTSELGLLCEVQEALYSSPFLVGTGTPHGTFLFESSLSQISSGEMVVRSNSFILEEQAVASVISSYEESPAPLVKTHAESELFLTPMYEKDSPSAQEGSHPCVGLTFIKGDNIDVPNEEGISMCKSALAMPDEKPNLQATFLCENSPADLANDAQFIHSKSEILNQTCVVETPVQTLTFNTPLFSLSDKNICTSTPLQNTSTNVQGSLSFTVSPCTESAGSPALRPMLKRNSVTPKKFEKGVSGDKVPKKEMSKFPKMYDKCKMYPSSSTTALDKPSQLHKNHEGYSFGCSRPSPVSNSSSTPSTRFKAAPSSPRRQNSEMKRNFNQQRSPFNSDEMQLKCKTLSYKSAASCGPASPNAGEGTSSQGNTNPETHITNATLCYPKKSMQKGNSTVSKPTPEERVMIKNKTKKDTAVGCGTSVSKSLNSCPCPSSNITVSSLFKMKPQRPASSFTVSKSKTASQGNSSCQTEGTMEAAETNCRKVKKIGLVDIPKILNKASCSTDTNTRKCGPPSPKPTGRGSTSKPPAASPMMATPLNRQRPGTSAMASRSTSTVGNLLSKQKSTGTLKVTGELSLAATPARTKPAAPRTTPRASLMGPPLTPLSRPQQSKTFGSTSNQDDGTNKARTTQVSGLSGRRATPLKVPSVKPKLITTLAKTNPPVLTAACKSAPSTRGLPNGPVSPPKRATTAKLIRLSSTVDRNKPKGTLPQQPQKSERGAPRPQQATEGAQDVGNVDVKETRVQNPQVQLQRSNHRFEALAIVLQQVLAQRDEAVRQSRGRSRELLELRGELMQTVNRSESLAQEKEALKASLQEALEELQTRHQRDLVDLEQRLRREQQCEALAAQQQLAEEQEKNRERLQQQLEEISASHVSLRQELEQSHSREMESVRNQHQLLLQELRDVHDKDLESFNKTLKDAEMVLNEKIRVLSQENAALMEKLLQEEEEKNNRDTLQKDSHTLYLEQELKSLNVVLDLKTEQLHQQEKKLMEVDKLTERNVKLGETLVKVQQENEDLKARMERHAALSRQLSTEQAQLQESLQKESKVNKRLSMENEELLWKLHNGDLSSPRKSSPNPPLPFGLGSPRSTPVFTSPPVSPR